MTALAYFVRVNSERPPFSCLAYFLWGSNADFDSDGNSSTPTDSTWTELTLKNRASPDERIDIDPDPVSDDLLILEIKGSSAVLAARAAYYLGLAVGEIAYSANGPFFEPTKLEEELGEFDIETALWHSAYF
jgi:hypothetical protein